MPAGPKKKVITGVRCKVVFGGEEVGRINNISPGESFGKQPVVGIGRLTPYEITTINWNGRFSFTEFLVEKQKVETTSRFLSSGKSVAQYIREVLTDEGFDIVIVYVDNGGQEQPLLKLKGCQISDRNWAVAEMAVVTKNSTGVILEPVEEF